MAKKKSSTCLISCGVGCLVLLIAGIVMVAGSAWFVKDTMSGFEQAVETRAALEERFGEPGDFTPAADGSISAERMEAFLAVREATAESRSRIADFFESLPMSEEEGEEIENQPFFEKMGTVAGITSSALGLGSSIGEFYEARNAAFDLHGMGLGEYSYIYVLAYYNLLGKSPDDGPGEEIDMNNRRTYSRVRRNLISNLENQLASLPGPGAEADPAAGQGPLAAEIEAMREDRRRIPWQDSLPAAIEESLAPYRDRLLDTWDPATNSFELARMEKRGRFSIQAN